MRKFHTLLDAELFLPEDWSDDRARYKMAGIPDSVVHRPKWKIALELIERAIKNGVKFRWVVADEGYGAVPEFRESLSQLGLQWVLEVPSNVAGWLSEPRLAVPPRQSAMGRAPWVERVSPDTPKTVEARELAVEEAPERLQNKLEWSQWHVKDTHKGPQMWDVQHLRFWPKLDDMPLAKHRLVIAAHPLNEARKYFLSNAPESVALANVLEVGFGRWHIEYCFRDEKQHIGMGQFEVRNWQGLQRHLVLCLVSLLFLQSQTTWLRGEKSPALEFRRRGCGGKNHPRWSLPQVKAVVEAQLDASEPQPRREQRLRQLIQRIEYHWRRNETATRSHRKTRIQKYTEVNRPVRRANRCPSAFT